MKLAFLIAFIGGVFISGGMTNSGDYRFVRSVDVAGDMHFSDPMGNVYVVKDNVLKKFSPSHTQAAHYTNAFLGNIYSVDVSDPLRILLYYKDHNQVVWIDYFLSEIRSPVWLDDLGIDQAELVCSSSRGGVWVFNGLNNQLQYYDVNLDLVHEGLTLNILTGPDIRPSFMLEKSRSLYLNVPGTGILVFDRFGNYARTLPVDTPDAFQVTEKYIYFTNEGQLFSYDLRTAETAALPLPKENGIGTEQDGAGPGQNEAGTGQEGSGMDPDGDSTDPGGRKILKAELQPGWLFIYTRSNFRVYKSNP